ncbi:EamA family transporter RarD [Arenicella xantha]|uniref:Chloramphenicol-sensitive protein RarD n=1 Tax=Arenicella xantha TaxID=644221 RepID=A0A395JNU9_9GAMM|nr:EamA family transporter RarD [Arenicella xantha]RBP53340.1 chloramphenicol-sensitive protein RarD [Arenicella xantha]
MNDNKGLFYAIGAYTWWGFIPIFWKQLDHVGPVEIVMHRMVWSCVMVTALIVMMGQWSEFKALFRDYKLLFRMAIASLLVSVNWGVFIWAVNTGRIVETSMGYFINPLISVVFGVLFFSERLRLTQVLAVGIAGCGVLYLIFGHGEFPLVALSLAVTFALYGVVKKSLSIPATHGLALETLLMFVPAAAYLIYVQINGAGIFGSNLATDSLLVLAGLFTLVPLLLFSAAAKMISLTALGMSQYIGPFLQLALGVLVYNEPFGSDRMIAFGLVWIALIIYSVDQLNHRRKTRRALRMLS